MEAEKLKSALVKSPTNLFVFTRWLA